MEAECAITPIYLTFEYGDFNTDYGIINLLVIGFMTMCWLRFDLKTNVHILPTFKPTEHMYKKFADKGSERWQAFAHAIRDVLSKKSGMKTSELP